MLSKICEQGVNGISLSYRVLRIGFQFDCMATNMTDNYAKRGELAAEARYAAGEGRFDQAEELLINALSFGS